MKITVTTAEGKVPVTVVKPHGNLDSSTYKELVNEGRKLIGEGAQHLLIDLGDVPFMSSAGMMSIHSLALMLRGDRPSSSKAGRSARGSNTPGQAAAGEHVKLLTPQEGVRRSFEKAGLAQFFEIFDDLESAIASF